MTSEKAYPTDELGGFDHGFRIVTPKPCARRINHANELEGAAAITWCTLREGHAGQCSGPPPRVLPVSVVARPAK